MSIDHREADHRGRALPRTAGCIAALMMFVGACQPSINYTASSRTYPARPENCQLVVVTAVPDPTEYRQIGIIDVNNNLTPEPIRSADEFRDAVAKTACEAGGHLIVAEANGYGVYVRGAVYRLIERD